MPLFITTLYFEIYNLIFGFRNLSQFFDYIIPFYINFVIIIGCMIENINKEINKY